MITEIAMDTSPTSNGIGTLNLVEFLEFLTVVDDNPTLGSNWGQGGVEHGSHALPIGKTSQGFPHSPGCQWG